jgi:ribonuclease HII
MLVCGVDEAGRGPLAGPVTAAAVILPARARRLFARGDLRDSKILTCLRRERAALRIREVAVAWAIGWAWPDEIDRLNIHHATLLAMRRAVASLPVRPDRVIVDGRFVPALPLPARAVVDADATLPAVIAAGIVAKTARDRWMTVYATWEPRYGFDRHKGYPTEEHRRLLHELGPSPIHRRSFTSSFPAGTGAPAPDLR